MDADDIKNLIKIGETESVKFLAGPKSPLEVYDCFKLLTAENTGVIIIGVKPDSTVVGIKKKKDIYISITKKAAENFHDHEISINEIELIRFFSVLVVSWKRKQ